MANLQEIIKLSDADSLKQIEEAVIMQSVVDLPTVNERYRPLGPIVFNIAQQADEFIPWGYNLKGRDSQLRGFWHTEPLMASAVYMMSARMAAIGKQVVGRDPKKERPRNTIMAVDRMLNSADRGKGWQHFMVKLMTDVFTQDNGGFIEIIRRENRPDSPVIGIAHLDSYMCERTGDPEVPVIYTDRKGRERKLFWWHVQTIEDMPSPVETMYGAQYCAVSRALRAAQIIRDIALYKKEKISGSFARSVHLVSGVTRQNIEDALALAQENMINMNLTRYNPPAIIPTIDPTARLGHVQIDLASLPDGFDEQTTLQWYITQMAIAFGVDYQEFAPLASGSLGSGQQSEILHLKSRGKGPAMMISLLEHIFNDNGILPSNVKMEFTVEDARGDEGRANARFLRAKDRSLRIDSGEIDAEAARQLAVLDGDLSVEVLEDMSTRPEPIPLRARDPLTSQQVTGGINSQTER